MLAVPADTLGVFWPQAKVPDSYPEPVGGSDSTVWIVNSRYGMQTADRPPRSGTLTQVPWIVFAHAPYAMRHPLNVTVTGQEQNPSLITPLNVMVTTPVVGFCEQLPDGVLVTLLSENCGYISAWFTWQTMGGVDSVQANRIVKLPLLYDQAKSQAPVRVSVPVIAVIGQPVLHAVFGGMGVLGPAANCSVPGSSRCPQQG